MTAYFPLTASQRMAIRRRHREKMIQPYKDGLELVPHANGRLPQLSDCPPISYFGLTCPQCGAFAMVSTRYWAWQCLRGCTGGLTTIQQYKIYNAVVGAWALSKDVLKDSP